MVGDTEQLATSHVATLVQRVREGDQAAWDDLVARFSPMIWNIARSYRLSKSDAADVSQTTWLRLVEHLDRINQTERLGAWLATTARRECLRIIRAGDRVTVAEEGFIDDVDLTAVDPDIRVLAEERDRVLWEAYARLPARCRVMLMLLTAEPSLSYKELSEVLDMPIGSIGPTRGRCLTALRRVVVELGITPED